jgi:hypothetical protein
MIGAWLATSPIGGLSTVNNTIPMTWASTDQILIYATYEAA